MVAGGADNGAPEMQLFRDGHEVPQMPKFHFTDVSVQAPPCLHGQRPSSAPASRSLGIPASWKGASRLVQEW